jgi:hypothetical protein
MGRHFRIHPAIGIARVGNSPEEHFVGPELPGIPGNWVGNAFQSFRDDAGRIKRQAARFRVFEYFDNSSSPKEVVLGADIVDIEWRVHIANRKGSFFTFNGQSGASDVYEARNQRSGTSAEKSDPARTNLRNSSLQGPDRQRLLELDPGEKLISKATPGPVSLTNPNLQVPFIPDLGELQLDEGGRLLVLGGHGTSGSTEIPPRTIDEYANNDTWFDDVGDGSIKARIRLADGSFIDADAAWVLVGPPKFAPGIANVVRLYDTLWDIAVQHLDIPAGNPLFASTPLNDLVEQKRAWTANNGKSLLGYRPSFRREIYPLLSRALSARQVHDPGGINRGYHLQLFDWVRLSSPNTGQARDPGSDARKAIFDWIRDPGSDEVKWEKMPRGLGDDYDDLEAGNPVPTSFLSLTQIQYALLGQWAKGNFNSDWPGQEPGIPAPGDITPAGLDEAALENCVGGPFYPGIELSWLVRHPELYSEPFRFRVPSAPETDQTSGSPLKLGALLFGPGFFSQQMAQPWQADFYDCHREGWTTPDQKVFQYMWWTAQRPDDVYPAGATEQQRWVRSFDRTATTTDPDDLLNLERFRQMQQNWSTLRFIVPAKQPTNHDFEEES